MWAPLGSHNGQASSSSDAQVGVVLRLPDMQVLVVEPAVHQLPAIEQDHRHVGVVPLDAVPPSLVPGGAARVVRVAARRAG